MTRSDDSTWRRLLRRRRAFPILASLLLPVSCATGHRGPVPSVPLPADDAPLPTPPLTLSLCEGVQISNPPPSDGPRVLRPSATGCLDGVHLNVAPAPGACLSSGFGPRRGREHRGIDLHRRPASPVLAAAGGIVRVADYRAQDFGHWVVLDHGNGVYTAYAHLATRDPRLRPGIRVARGLELGTMGSSGAATRAVHLHYEVRRGNYDVQGWWGMSPVDPLGLPARCDRRPRS